MTTDQQISIANRIAALSPPHCKKCPQPVFMIADHTQPSQKHFDESGNLSTVDFPLVQHESGLCFFHLKKELGIFDAKYPLKHKLGGGEI